MENNTPNPLTAAIEEKIREELLANFFDGDSWEEARAASISNYGALDIAMYFHTLGKQEGMDEGAESAVEFLRNNQHPLSEDDLENVGLVVLVESTLAAARTAHKQDIPVGRCECDGPYTCKTHEGEFTFCTNARCLCHVRTAHRGDSV